MPTKLYIGNLPYSFTVEDLKKILEPYGEAEEVVIIMDKFSGRSRGYGFATLKDAEKAALAIQELNGKEFEGRPIVVNESRPREEGSSDRRSSFGGGNRSGGYNRGGNDRGGSGRSDFTRRDRY